MTNLIRYGGNSFTRFQLNDFFRNSLFDEFLGLATHAPIEPASDVKEDNESYTIQLSVPGLTRDDLKVELNENVISVNYQKDEEEDRSIFSKSFSYQRVLPKNVEFDKLNASLNNGILSLYIPKTREEKRAPRPIEIK